MVASALGGYGVQRLVGLAPQLARPFLGQLPVNDRGVTIDVGLYTALRVQAASGRPTFDELGPVRAREEWRNIGWLLDVPLTRLAEVEDRKIPGPETDIPIRIYTPRHGPDPLPALVYFHGGGFVMGDLDTHDRICRFLSRRAGAKVIAVDYRLAPEHPFPAGVEDVLAAFRWIAANADELAIDPERIAVGGDSAGGNLSAVLTQQLSPDEPRPRFQLLLYPGTDLTRSAESHATFREGFFLTSAMTDWFVANYLPSPTLERDPRASPLMTAELAGLPPAHVIVAGFDPLRDEGEAYAHALMAAGVPTTLRGYASLIHGFCNMTAVSPAARRALEDAGDVLRAHLWQGTRR